MHLAFLSMPRRILVGALLVVGLVVGLSGHASAQIPDLVITVGDTIGSSGEQNSVITVYMDNFFDTVAAFELWLRIGNYNILEFQTDTLTVYDTTWWICKTHSGPDCVDWVGADDSVTYWQCNTWNNSVCTDSTRVSFEDSWDFEHVADTMIVDVHQVQIGSIDTAGTMTSGWEYVISRSVFGSGEEIKVTGVADRWTIPGSVPGIAPQQGGVLFRLLADIFPISDTVTQRTSAIIPDPFRDNTGFSRPDGTRIGEADSLRLDSNFYRCDSWVPPDSNICLYWTKVGSGEYYDSVFVEIDTVTYVDFNKLKLYSGSLTVEEGICGQVDNDPAQEIDIGDLTYLITYLFMGGPAPQPMSSGDVDCVSGVPPIDVGDLTYMITYLFIGGSAPCDCQ